MALPAAVPPPLSGSTGVAVAQKTFCHGQSDVVVVLTCSACGREGKEFSNRQKNKALMLGIPARCKDCIQDNVTIPAAAVAVAAAKNALPKINGDSTHDDDDQPKTKQKERRLYFSDGESVDASSSTSSSSSSSSTTNSSSSSSSSEEPQDVSLDAIKEKILGRKLIVSSSPLSPPAAEQEEEDTTLSQPPPLSTTFENAAAVLKKELSCPICHEPLYEPKSLHCGHSFCSQCLEWWLSHSRTQQSSSMSLSLCPTCRQPLMSSCHDGQDLGINTALRACVTVLYGADIRKRAAAQKEAKRRATKGENGGAHNRGYQVLTLLAEEEWRTLLLTECNLMARRSIVLDEEDQRMQLALAVDGRPFVPRAKLVDSNHILHVSLCLLTMEEDEVSDSGFPLVLNDEEEDDGHLVCTEERFHSPITATVSVPGRSNGGVLAMRRSLANNHGTVHFELDLGEEQDHRHLWEVCFLHEETGAEFAIRLSSREGSRMENGALANDEVVMHQESRLTGRDLVMDGPRDSDDDDSPDEYEDDGFVVMNEDEEDSDSNDTCCICNEHGILIVCDGGDDHPAGCGKSFHSECVGRDRVPPGDWICQACANAIDLDVGIEGHEFPVEHDDASSNASEDARQAAGKRVLEESSEDEGEDSEVEAFVPAGKKSKPNNRTRVLDSDSDED